jgi:hypothetical protein
MRIRNTACYPNWEEIDMICCVLSKSEIKPQYLQEFVIRAGTHEQLISNSVLFKPAFAKRDEKQAMIDLRGISTNWLKNQLCPTI